MWMTEFFACNAADELKEHSCGCLNKGQVVILVVYIR